MDQSLHKISDAMKRLDVCRAKIYRMASRGELELGKVGRATRITSTSLDRVINAGRAKS